MITFLYGNNNYQARQALNKILQNFVTKEGIERYDDSLSPAELPSILTSLSLFAPERLVVLSGLSANKDTWAALGQEVASIPDEVHVVVHEEQVDKRTKTFKDLQKLATVVAIDEPTEVEAVQWLIDEATKRGASLASAQAQAIVARVGLNQWQLHFALEKLVGFDEITHALIQEIVEATPQASAFELIDAALGRQPEKVLAMVKTLRVSEDAYFFFGLLASQLFQLISLNATKKSPNLVAKDLGTHPYPLQKLQGIASRLKANDRKTIATILADCDNLLKRSGAEPWLVLEQALLKLASP